MRNGLLLGVDVGASSLRAALVRGHGRVVAATAIPLAAREPRDGWSEIEPERWWTALCAAIARALRAMPPGGVVQGLCICGLTRTQVLLDRRGRALGPAILFRDRRAAGLAREMDGVTAFDPAARLAWIARHRPARFGRIHAVVEPKDFMNYRLTGVLAADTVTQSRQRGAAPFAPREALAPWQQVGVVQAVAPPLARIAGVPVFAGALDTWASAVGAGAVRPGQAYDVAGTSEAVGLVTASRAQARELVALDWTERSHQVGGPTQAGADCARWCHTTFRIRGSLTEAIERAGRGAPRGDRPIFLPYLAGERAPVWSSEVRGAFHGVDRASTPDDFLWAVLEGVAMAVRDIVEHAQRTSGTAATELRAAGGGARSDAWCRMKADVVGIPVLRAKQAETGVIGAAIAAAVGLRRYASVSEAADVMAAPGRRFEPRHALAALFDARAAKYRQVKAAALALAEGAGS